MFEVWVLVIGMVSNLDLCTSLRLTGSLPLAHLPSLSVKIVMVQVTASSGPWEAQDTVATANILSFLSAYLPLDFLKKKIDKLIDFSHLICLCLPVSIHNIKQHRINTRAHFPILLTW